MSRIISTFILGMATMSFIAFSMTVISASAQQEESGLVADCRVVANIKKRVIYDSGAVRVKIAGKEDFVLSEKQQHEFSQAIYFPAWPRASANGVLQIAMNVGKNSNIAGMEHNRLIGASGHLSGPVEFEYRMQTGTVFKMECQVVK